MTDVTTETPAGGDAGGTADGKATEATTLLGGAATEQNPEAKPETGEQPADGGEGGEKPEGENPEGEKPTEPVVPEKYEFAMPEGYTLDEARAGEFEAFARSNKLTNEAANEALAIAVKHVEGLQEQQQAAWREQVEGWGNEIRTDKDLGGDKLQASMNIAQKAIARFGTPELVDFLESSGIGNHPALVRFCYQIGTRISEGGMITGAGAGEGRRSTADVFYSKET